MSNTTLGQKQKCRYCGDFYRCDDKEFAISDGRDIVHNVPPVRETEDGWVIDICHQCHTEFNSEEEALSEAWQWWYDQQLDEENEDERHKTP